MNKLSIRILVLAAAGLFAATQPFAQEPKSIAKLADLHGNVLVSTSSGLAAANPSTALSDGVRIITTNKAGATVIFDDGCRVTMKENQRLEVKMDKPCEIRLAGLQSLLPGPAAPIIATGPVVAPAAAATISAGEVAGFGAFVGLAVLDSRRNSRSVSPS
jgi:hypothetical protein